MGGSILSARSGWGLFAFLIHVENAQRPVRAPAAPVLVDAFIRRLHDQRPAIPRSPLAQPVSRHDKIALHDNGMFQVFNGASA